MEYLRSEGFVVDVSERHSPRPARTVLEQGRERMTFFLDRKKDLFGGLDLVAVRRDAGIVGVQVCRYKDHANRRAKILCIPELRLWVEHAQIWVVSWQKKADPPGSKRMLWTPRIEKLTPEDFAEAAGPQLEREWRRLARA